MAVEPRLGGRQSKHHLCLFLAAPFFLRKREVWLLPFCEISPGSGAHTFCIGPSVV